VYLVCGNSTSLRRELPVDVDAVEVVRAHKTEQVVNEASPKRGVPADVGESHGALVPPSHRDQRPQSSIPQAQVVELFESTCTQQTPLIVQTTRNRGFTVTVRHRV
jgi:hypothetical protein